MSSMSSLCHRSHQCDDNYILTTGDVEGANWLDVAKPAIEERMSRYSASETHFTLMSIRKMKSTSLEVFCHSF